MAENTQRRTPLKVAWISDFPIEWLPDLPPALQHFPRTHPATWQVVLAGEFEKDPTLELHIVVLRKGIAHDVQFERNGIRFHVIKVMGGLRAPSCFWVDTLLIRRVFDRIQPRLVHAWGTERGAALVGLRLGRPCLVTIQGMQSWYNEIIKASAYQRFIGQLEKHVLRRAGDVSGESRYVVDRLARSHPHLRLHHVEHVPMPFFHTVQRRPQTKPVRLLFTGHLDERKGADLLFNALNQLQSTLDFELVHAGSSNATCLDALKAATSADLWKRYKPVGHMTSQQIAQEMERSTMAVIPTRADTGPVAAKEAAVAGVPVVATRMGGIPEYITDGGNGVLVAEPKVEALLKALQRACAHPEFGVGQVNAGAKARAQALLDPALMARGFRAVYEKMMGRDGHAPEISAQSLNPQPRK